MNADAKKTVLRMIPYGIYVLTADDGKGNVAAATVNWVTQSAFAPPLVVLGVKADSGTYKTVKAAQTFALNMLGKDHKNLAFTFFRPADVSEGKISGQAYRKGATGAPILVDAPGAANVRSTRLSSRATTTLSSARWSRRISTSRSPAGRTRPSSR